MTHAPPPPGPPASRTSSQAQVARARPATYTCTWPNVIARRVRPVGINASQGIRPSSQRWPNRPWPPAQQAHDLHTPGSGGMEEGRPAPAIGPVHIRLRRRQHAHDLHMPVRTVRNGHSPAARPRPRSGSWGCEQRLHRPRMVVPYSDSQCLLRRRGRRCHQRTILCRTQHRAGANRRPRRFPPSCFSICRRCREPGNWNTLKTQIFFTR